MSRMAFFTRVLAFSQVVPPSLSSAGADAPGVFLDEIEPLERNEQLVVAGVAELHELLLGRLAGGRIDGPDREPLQPDESADAVVDVDDEVVELEVAEVGDERAGGRLAALVNPPFFLEEIGLGEDQQARVDQVEPARERAGRHEHGGELEVVVLRTSRVRGPRSRREARPRARRGPACRRRRRRDRRDRAPS